MYEYMGLASSMRHICLSSRRVEYILYGGCISQRGFREIIEVVRCSRDRHEDCSIHATQEELGKPFVDDTLGIRLSELMNF